MKKTYLILAILLSGCGLAFSQNTFIKIYADSSGNAIVFYVNNLGEISSKNISGLNAVIIGAIKDSVNAIPKAMAAVGNVTYNNQQITITGNPPRYDTFVSSYSSLSSQNKAIIDSLSVNITLVKGVTMTSFYTLFGSNKITINGITYSYADFEVIPRVATAFQNAIILANKLYNGL